jgi:hypothetical protein
MRGVPAHIIQSSVHLGRDQWGTVWLDSSPGYTTPCHGPKNRKSASDYRCHPQLKKCHTDNYLIMNGRSSFPQGIYGDSSKG